ncbi:MAG: hypothetical protein R3F46_02595 [bacterium]
MNDFQHGPPDPEPGNQPQPDAPQPSQPVPPQGDHAAPKPGAIPRQSPPPAQQMPPQWEHAVPPIPEYQPRNTGVNGLLKGLGIACLGCIGAGAGLFGACFVVMGALDAQTIPYVAGSALVFVAAALALYFLVRPRR